MPLLVCHAVAWVREEASPSHPLSPEAGERAGPVGTKVRELTLPLIKCNTEERDLYPAWAAP